MKPYKHQEELAIIGGAILKQNGIAYLAMEERTGKTLTSILIAEMSPYTSVAVVTKKKAIAGWNETLDKYFSNKENNFTGQKNYIVTNYHQAHKLNPDNFDLVIVDEAHNYISSYPKPGKIWKEMKALCKNKPIIYLSATPHAQGVQLLYHQFAISSYSPWKEYVNFYRWFAIYGKPYTLEIHGQDVNQYDRADEEKVLADVKHLFVTKTREELGFEHEPEDVIHFVELDEVTKQVYNELQEHNLIELKAGTLVCDTTMKLRTSLHMLEGGVAKIDDQYVILANDEKVRYIHEHFGDNNSLVIMYNYIAEGDKLRKAFNRAHILQATSNAEGVDLSQYSDLVIYSQDFSTARHTQRRARQANKNRSERIHVHFLLVKKAISEQVYKTVSVNKKNFVDSVYKRNKL